MNNIIVSLTTTSKRLSLCRAALFSLATQSVIPRIILNVSKEAYLRDEGVNDERLINSLISDMPIDISKNIEIQWVKNTGPYRKLMPTLQKAKHNDIIVTADDDIFYDKDWLKSLLDDFDPNDRVIHAGRVRQKKKNFLGLYVGYMHWPIITDEVLVRGDWIITFGGGAVLCKSWFSDEIINDKGYLDVSPTADDLWYSKISQLSHLKVKVVPDALAALQFIQHNDGLVNNNLPLINNFISKVKNKFIDNPLNYIGLVKFGNDRAHDAIERYFH